MHTMNKVFKFKLTRVNDLTNSPEVGCNEIVCGKYSFTLKDFSINPGHDDSLPYTAILCINRIPVAKCFNDGWGADTEITPINPRDKKLLDEVKAELKKYKWSFHDTTLTLDIPFIADTLTCNEEL